LDYHKAIQDRVQVRERKSLLHVRTTLKHFSIITYAVPKGRLSAHIPERYFDIPENEMNLPHSIFVSPSIKFEIHLPPRIPKMPGQ